MACGPTPRFEAVNQRHPARATLSQQKTYLFNDIMGRLGRHMATLQKYPPKQKGSSLSIGD